MKGLFIVLCVGLFLFVGCSLQDDEASVTVAGPRLLLTNGKPAGLLSDPNANDWAPQMVTIKSSVTNRYLYFLSDRNLPYYSVYRARHVSGASFENLEVIYSNTMPISSFVVSDSNSEGNPEKPDMYVSLSNSSSEKFVLRRFHDFNADWDTNPMTSFNLAFPTGVYTIGSASPASLGYIVFLYFELSSYKVIRAYKVDNTGELSTLSGTTIYPIGRTVQKFNLGSRKFRGGCPIRVRTAEGGEAFGFLFSYGGVFYLAYNKNAGSFSQWVSSAPDIVSYTVNNYFNGERVVSFYAIEHAIGSIDRDPHFDSATGLYFSSNRDGRFDLYFAPKSFFQFNDNL